MSLHFGLSRASCQCKCTNDCIHPFLLSWMSFSPLPVTLSSLLSPYLLEIPSPSTSSSSSYCPAVPLSPPLLHLPPIQHWLPSPCSHDLSFLLEFLEYITEFFLLSKRKPVSFCCSTSRAGSAATLGSWARRVGDEEPWASERIQLRFEKQNRVPKWWPFQVWDNVEAPVSLGSFLSCLLLFEKCFGSHPTLAELRDRMVPLFVKAKPCFLKPQTRQWMRGRDWKNDRLKEASYAE